jgi:hypothetical protein
MNKPDRPDEPKQKTLKGHEITLPERGAIFAAFKKIAKPGKKLR